MKYADLYEIPLAILYGSNEKESGMVTIKNMDAGRVKAGELGDRSMWLAARPGQISVPRTDLIEAVQRLISQEESQQ